ncbi:interleukin-17 receptor B isoform X2 [Lepisosteus oculatus]|uniref:interleukin-17 receptor B isoform X2 n=1 Tax=Lepisosteus oculatus TaxID=7918 RepID=UPI003713F541
MTGTLKHLTIYSLLQLLSAEVTRLPQQGVKCVEQDHGTPPAEWLKEHALTPSDLRDLTVTVFQNEHLPKSTGPSLNISWSVSTDGSLQFLKATIININGKQFRCNYLHPFNECSSQDQWWFHFTDYIAKPESEYLVSALNIPPPNIKGEEPKKHRRIKTPSCNDERMKHHRYCVERGSTWEPDIHAIIRYGQIEMSFIPSRLSKTYSIASLNCKDCLENVPYCCLLIDEYDISVENDSRISTRITASEDCKSMLIEIIPYFDGCKSDCRRLYEKVDCSQIEETTPMPVKISDIETTPKPDIGNIYITVIIISIGLFAVLVSGIYIWYRHSRSGRSFDSSTATVTVLIVYPPENHIFQKAVVSFAEFLQLHCKCRVSIDAWQGQKIAELGLVPWLAKQKETVDKIVVICTNTVSSHWPSSNPDLSNHAVPASVDDLFTLTLNMLISGMKHTDLRQYLIVCFDNDFSKKHLPAVLKPCQLYRLMKDLESFCANLHGTSPKRTCCQMGPGRSPYTKEMTTKLKDAIYEFQKWEASQINFKSQRIPLIKITTDF